MAGPGPAPVLAIENVIGVAFTGVKLKDAVAKVKLLSPVAVLVGMEYVWVAVAPPDIVIVRASPAPLPISEVARERVYVEPMEKPLLTVWASAALKLLS